MRIPNEPPLSHKLAQAEQLMIETVSAVLTAYRISASDFHCVFIIDRASV